MTLSNDSDTNSKSLSPVAERLLELRSMVFEEWEKRVRASVKEARPLSHPVLIDSLPAYYMNLVESISPEHSRMTATDTTNLASEHGGMRARLTDYDPQSVIHEYQIFRWVIFDVLAANGVQLTDAERLTINTSIDSALREAVTSFSLVLAALREQFTAALTHDLRNPLNAASVAVQLIQRQTDSPLIRDLAARAHENLLRIDQMSEELLDSMASRKRVRPVMIFTEFNFLDVVHEVVDQASAAYGPRFQIVGVSISGHWNREAIKRVIENLITNAVKYGTPDSAIRIDINEAHERLQIAVHNEGAPIPPNEQENIFLIFERSQSAKQRSSQGWGIGLPFVRSVAEGHGGTISVDSSAERGTTFLFDVPRDARPFQNAPAFLDRRQSAR